MDVAENLSGQRIRTYTSSLRDDRSAERLDCARPVRRPPAVNTDIDIAGIVAGPTHGENESTVVRIHAPTLSEV